MTNPYIPTAIIRSLETLAKRLDVTVNALWEVLIKQSYVEGAQFAIVCVSLLIGILVLGRIKKKAGERKVQTGEGGYIYTSSILTLIQVGIGAVITAFSIQAASRFINPEFYAIAKIIDTLKGYLH